MLSHARAVVPCCGIRCDPSGVRVGIQPLDEGAITREALGPLGLAVPREKVRESDDGAPFNKDREAQRHRLDCHCVDDFSLFTEGNPHQLGVRWRLGEWQRGGLGCRVDRSP